jgi:hypothetical protein
MPKHAHRLTLREDAGPLTRERGKVITERGRLLEATTSSTATATRRNIQIITPGWGSSGYYSPEVLERRRRRQGDPRRDAHVPQPRLRDRAPPTGRSATSRRSLLCSSRTPPGTGLALTAPVGPASARNARTRWRPSRPTSACRSPAPRRTSVVGEAEGRRGPIIEGLALRGVRRLRHPRRTWRDAPRPGQPGRAHHNPGVPGGHHAPDRGSASARARRGLRPGAHARVRA